MVSDQEIAESLGSLLRETNPNSFTTLNDIVLRLQSKLGYDLSHKLDFIRAQINLIFSACQPQRPPPPLPQPLSSNPTPPTNPIFRATPSHYHPQTQGPVFRSNATEINFAQPSLNSPHHQALSAPSHLGPNAPSKDSQSKPKRRGGPGGLNKLCGVSPELQAIVGEPALPRTQIVKQLWAYIRKNNLQDPSNKRKIICNDELRRLFKTDSTDMFQMNKLLSKHILPLDPSKGSDKKSKKLKVEEAPDMKNTESNPVIISDALANFFGTSEKEMLQDEVFGRLSEYIKMHGLGDTLNSMVVCDAKLQDLFGCESIPAAGMYDVLARNHLFQRS